MVPKSHSAGRIPLHVANAGDNGDPTPGDELARERARTAGSAGHTVLRPFLAPRSSSAPLPAAEHCTAAGSPFFALHQDLYDSIAQWLSRRDMLALMTANKGCMGIVQSILERRHPGILKQIERNQVSAPQVLGAADARSRRVWEKIISSPLHQFLPRLCQRTARGIAMRSDRQVLCLRNTEGKAIRTVLETLTTSDIKHLRLEVAEPILKVKFLRVLQELLRKDGVSVCFDVSNAANLSAGLLRLLQNSPKAIRLELRCALAQIPAKFQDALIDAIASGSMRSLLLYLEKQQGEREVLALQALRGHKTLTHLSLVLSDAKVDPVIIDTIVAIPTLRTLMLAVPSTTRTPEQIDKLSHLLEAINACDHLTSVNLRLSKRGAPVFGSEPLSARGNSKLTNNLSLTIGGLKKDDVITTAQILQKNRSLIELNFDTHGALDEQANQALAKLLSEHPTLVRLCLHSGENYSTEDVMRHYTGLIKALPAMDVGKEIMVVLASGAQQAEISFSSGMAQAADMA